MSKQRLDVPQSRHDFRPRRSLNDVESSSAVYTIISHRSLYLPSKNNNLNQVSQTCSSSSSNGTLLSQYTIFSEFLQKHWSSFDMTKSKSFVYKRTKRLPLASLMALGVSWIGLALFCTKTYNGAVEIENLSKDLFAFLIPWIEKFKLGLIILGIFMACVTLAMTLVGFLATQHCHCSYKNRPTSCMCSNFGGRLMCAVFWLLSYLLNLCWLGILSLTVVMTAAYLAFLPVCLPQAGQETNFCFNFTLFSLMISGGKDANAVSLILCGGPIDKFCKLSKAVMPWFWGSYIGCIAVLLGLSHFNGSLAANFAHGKHAIRYRKLRKSDGSPLTLYAGKWRTPESIYENGNGKSNDSKCCHDETCKSAANNKNDAEV